MTRIIMHGCNGHMGQVIASLVEQDPDAEIVAGIDIFDQGKNPFPVYKTLNDVKIRADVIIDFSSARAVDSLLDYVEETRMALVICTTGLTKKQLDRVEKAAETAPVLMSANMSLGVNTLLKLLQDAAKVLAPAGFDMEIVERHHKYKLDAPSGTAIALADSLNEAMDGAYHYVFDRSERREQRNAKEIGISAIRGGNIVGVHEVIFSGTDEVVEFKHTATSKAVFGKGAVEAAKFLTGKPAGRYEMRDVIESKN